MTTQVKTPEQKVRYARRQRARDLLNVYEATLIAEGLPPDTWLSTFMEHCIAKGANNLLTVQCKDEWKLAHDPDARWLPELKARLDRADHCIRNHPMEDS